MFAFRTPPVLYLLLFLLPASSCFAVIRYVNANNPTPGAGTSWATAYNDLNAAIAASAFPGHYGDEIWVAQGTYKPTTTTNRSATFLCTFGYSLYGGFNGTETARTQRDPKTYITILSGDIGVTGDASDNSYHVVTLQGFQGGRDFDGFTIRDGNANAGYPGSTTPQADNCGGGVLELALAGDNSRADLKNDIITNNFAVYGGGFGSYGDGTSAQSFFGINTILFNNNTAVFGGAVAALVLNGDWGGPTIQNCIFINNISLTAGSVLACVVDNPYTGGVHSDIENCTLYNNGEQVVYNLPVGSAVSNVALTNDIVWKSGAPYTSVISGPAISFDNCDVDLVTPLTGGGNLDADPLFVNAAGNDFHLTPCSPCIDKGYDIYGVTTDYEGTARPQGAAKDIGAYEATIIGPVSAAPTIAGVSYCQNATAIALTATGTNLLWYTAASGGTGSATAPVPSTATAGVTNFYVTQTLAGNCESIRTPLPVTIRSLPAAPTATSPTYCQFATATALTATGSSKLWYTVAAGGSGTGTAPVPSTATAGTTTWYVTQTVSCESARTPVTVTINTTPAAPATAPVNYCQNATAVSLTATGSNLLWYTAATGGSGTAMAPTPSTTASGITTYYVSQTIGCESPRSAIAVTVGAQPAAPTAASPSYCQNDAAVALTATGTNLLWYTTATGGTGAATAPTPATATAGSFTYYVSQTTGCESARTLVTVTVNKNPTAIFDWSPACIGAASTISALSMTATPDSYNWDFGTTASVSGSGAGPYLVIWNTDGDHAVTLTAITGTCQSKATHNVTVYALPQVSVSPVTEQLCAGGAVTLNATGASLYQWSPATNLSDAAVSNPVAVLKSDIIYTVSGTDNNGCANSAQIELKPVNCQVSNTGYNIPDAFTPNGDGKNDLFRVNTADTPQSFRMMIFNRYGGKVFESRDVQTGWNGTMGSGQAMTGVYVYTIVIKTSTGTTIEKKGTVVLIR
ncbi:hypothetical protein A3860_32425 [Niastella vici]|uniref:Ig-like domain-containing protein n=1 Tax=Niastella vici TaxID=1703345 RepID=A0A1V9FQZ3_9BACT|nr:gliding motility-associated C-terminal domain-containing protein [Niastella vici]OQP60707.1 hypothetical protein A3860_32425 [Niastella vici]